MASFGGSNSSGTISVANGSTAVTGGGAVDWADISERDMLFAGGNVGLIETFDATAKTITLYDPWAGTTLVAAPYTILFSSPDRYDPTLNATRQQRLLDRLESATTFDLISDHGTDVASASTINLQATGVSNILDITGSTTINSITLANGDFRFVRFAAAPLLVNSSTLVLPGGANIRAAAGDMAIFVGYAAGVVRCLQFTKASGLPVVVPTAQGSGYFKFSSSALCLFVPYNGDKVTVAGVLYTILSAGIAFPTTSVRINGTAGGSLAANTTYIACVQDDGSGTLVPSYWTAPVAHGPSTSYGGVEVITSAPQCTVVGLVWVNGSGQLSAQCICSWYNRRFKVFSFSGGNFSTTSITSVASMAAEAITSWGTDVIWISYLAQAGTSGSYAQVAAYINGTLTSIATFTFSTADPIALPGYLLTNTNDVANSVEFRLGASSGTGTANVFNQTYQIGLWG